MYERNAIVLERYFYQLFDFKNSSNLKQNYFNYRKLFECYGNLRDAEEKEKNSKEEYDIISKEISKLQKTQEKLYNKGAKFEYSRYVIFNNISESTENIEKYLEKVNLDVQKNAEELNELGQKFIQTVTEYNEKEANFTEAVEQRKNAQSEYDNAYLKAKECYEELTEEKIKIIENFINSDNKDNKKELQLTFEENGKNEKNQFDQDVILNTINKSIEIYKNEMDVYLAGFDRISKLFEEIENDSLKIDKHTKYYRDSKAKVDFINAEKDYIIQFLDNERIGAIYDKKVHRKLMLEACKKFALDFAQIDNLYEIILKEIAGRSTKKIYKENYNREYLYELEKASIEPSLDTGKMRQEAIAFVNLNYWRVEGMSSIYKAFENVVTSIYCKDLSEFIPEELKQAEINEFETESQVEDIENSLDVPDIQEELIETKKHYRVYYSSKISLANAIYHSLQTREFANNNDEDRVSELEYVQEEYSIPENVKEILSNENEIGEENESTFDLSKLDEIEELEDINDIQYIEDDLQEDNIEEDIEEDDIEDINIEDIDIEDDDTEEVDIEDDDEESILEIYYSENNKNESKNTTETVKKKASFFKKLVGLNSKEKKKA